MNKVEKFALGDTLAFIGLVVSSFSLMFAVLSNDYYRSLVFPIIVIVLGLASVFYLIVAFYEWRVSVNSRKV